ncbi:MAG: hypothetical protein LUD02_07060 [Tannerellaceae bacterium]|nr:hypothetical protein [Tannerellaceae bacterium]
MPDSKGNCWIGTKNGLFIKEKDKNPTCIMDSADISDIFEDRNRQIWIATRYRAIYKIKEDGETIHYLQNENNCRFLSNLQVRCFAEDNYGNLWIGTFNGLNKYNPYTDEFTAFTTERLPGSLSHPSIFSLYKDRQGTIWVGTYYGGVNYFNPETDIFSYYPEDAQRNTCLSYYFVGNMLEDKDKNIWICTEGGRPEPLQPEKAYIQLFPFGRYQWNSP